MYLRLLFQKLENKLHISFEEYRKQNVRLEISERHIILMSLWILTSNETVESVSKRFCISRICCQQAFIQFCNVITKDNYRSFVHWPTPRIAQQIIHKFNADGGTFPNVCGIIGCLTITSSKFNQNEEIKLQSVCDSNGYFLDCSVTTVESRTSIFSIFAKSPLHTRLQKNEVHVRPNSHLIGNRSYPLRKYLLVPFKDRKEKLTISQRRYNEKLTSKLPILDRSFACLKERFVQMSSLENIHGHSYLQTITGRQQTILVACAIHNFCIQHEDTYFINNEIDVKESTGGESFETCHDVDLATDIIAKRNAVLRTFEN